jgi:dienelactone hydrolase
VPVLADRATRACEGYTERELGFEGAEGEVPALLLVPDRPSGGGVVVHHQHASQWHLGKSEVAGRAGDPWQAFGPALARRGVTVLAADAPGFEDRRRGPAGTDRRPTDRDDYLAGMAHRLVQDRLLMSTVLADAAAAHTALCALPGIDPARVGTVGHSMGGATALFHAALDPRVAFAAVSGAACTYRHRIAHGTGIEAAQTIPGVLSIGDLDDVVTLVAPRPLLLCSATEDKYSADAPVIAAAAAAAYGALGAGGALRHERVTGGHALTEARFAAIVRWTADRASAGESYSA